jgi:hypothetical protein
MDRPSVERELRHVHGDTTYYPTAHAARAALSNARTAAEAPQNPPPDRAAAINPENRSTGQPFDLTPRGGWTAADRVAPPRPPNTSSYPSAQQYPLGTPLTVHVIGADGPGRQLGHGVVVEHPGPAHVTVESPYGTRRISPISHVRTTATNLTSPAPPTGTAEPAATDRWQHLFTTAHRAVLADPHWPALAAQIDRIAATGADVAALVANITAERELPDDHPARNLDYRLANAAPPPPTTRPGEHDAPPPGVTNPAAGPSTPQPRSGPQR